MTPKPEPTAANDQREDYNRSVWAERYATALGSDTDPSAGVGQSSVGSAAGPAAATGDELVRVGDVWLDLDPRGPERKVMVTEFRWPYAYVVSSTHRRHTRIHQATLTKKFRLESRLP